MPRKAATVEARLKNASTFDALEDAPIPWRQIIHEGEDPQLLRGIPLIGLNVRAAVNGRVPDEGAERRGNGVLQADTKWAVLDMRPNSSALDDFESDEDFFAALRDAAGIDPE